MKTSKATMILSHLIEVGPISAWEAASLYRSLALHSLISELRNGKGVPISDKWETQNGARFKTYFLEPHHLPIARRALSRMTVRSNKEAQA